MTADLTPFHWEIDHSERDDGCQLVQNGERRYVRSWSLFSQVERRFPRTKTFRILEKISSDEKEKSSASMKCHRASRNKLTELREQGREKNTILLNLFDFSSKIRRSKPEKVIRRGTLSTNVFLLGQINSTDGTIRLLVEPDRKTSLTEDVLNTNKQTKRVRLIA